MEPLRLAVYGTVGVIMFATFLNWIDRLAVRIDYYGAYKFPQKWVLWAKITSQNHETHQPVTLYMLIIRLPSYSWGYSINHDDFRWMQNAYVWRSKYTGMKHLPKGWSRQELTPLPSYEQKIEGS